MSPQIARIGVWAFIVVLFVIEYRRADSRASLATWVPTLWMGVAGSRTLSQWLDPELVANGSSEGTPLDRLFFFGLILLGILILIDRRFSISDFAKRNRWLVLYFLFAAASILWSWYPVDSAKRLIKSVGNLVMALLILTEESPRDSLVAVIRRLGMVLVPLSWLYVKYFPDLGRQYHMGQPLMRGVALQKNGLGQLCMIVGIVAAWQWILNTRGVSGAQRSGNVLYGAVVVPVLGWLLLRSDSATSLMGLGLACGLLALGRIGAVARQPSKLVSIGLILGGAVILAEGLFHLSSVLIVNVLGRDLELTGRVDVWATLIGLARRPVIGAGYESFWLTSNPITETFGLNQAHNGYLETYLNLGLVGLGLLVLSIGSAIVKNIRSASLDFAFSYLRLTLVIVIIFYNLTEAMYHGVNNLWVLFLVSAITVETSDMPIPALDGPDRSSDFVADSGIAR